MKMTTCRVSAIRLSRSMINISKQRQQVDACRLASVRSNTSRTFSVKNSPTVAFQQDVKLASRIERAGSKLFKDADEAVADLKSGTTLLSSGFGLCGVAGRKYPTTEEIDPDIVNAGKETATLLPGASTFDSSESFRMIIHGRVNFRCFDKCLGFAISANGDLTNYMIPGKAFKGMGGAMDLVSNPDKTRIVVTTTHVAKDCSPKIVQKYSLPLTGANCVSTIITDLCVFQVDRANGGLALTELAPGVGVEEIESKTGARFSIAGHLSAME